MQMQMNRLLQYTNMFHKHTNRDSCCCSVPYEYSNVHLEPYTGQTDSIACCFMKSLLYSTVVLHHNSSLIPLINSPRQGGIESNDKLNIVML